MLNTPCSLGEDIVRVDISMSDSSEIQPWFDSGINTKFRLLLITQGLLSLLNLYCHLECHLGILSQFECQTSIEIILLLEHLTKGCNVLSIEFGVDFGQNLA